MKKLKWYFWIHHAIPIEPLTEPKKNRVKFVKENKSKNQIETRLKYMTMVEPPRVYFITRWNISMV